MAEMGRNNTVKNRSGPTKLFSASKNLPFLQSVDRQAGLTGPSDKMATAEQVPQAPVTKQDWADSFKTWTESFKAFESDLMDRLNEVLQPIVNKVEEIADNLREVEKTAETALEVGMLAQEDIKELRSHEKWATDKILLLEQKLRQQNLKVRGVPEGAEQNSTLEELMANWIQSFQDISENVQVGVKRSYRLGPRDLAQKRGPRDILVEFADMSVKRAMLDKARETGFLMFKDSKVLLLPDLPMEALARRRVLKPVTSALMAANIRYRWSPASTLTVRHQGSTLQASDREEGEELLHSLGLNSSAAAVKKSSKRKIDLTSTPPRWSKIPVRHSP